MSYKDAGFDDFLSRSIDDTPQINLDTTGPVSTQMRFDSAQTSGSLGDTLQIGSIRLNGSAGTIIVSDGSNDRLVIGSI